VEVEVQLWQRPKPKNRSGMKATKAPCDQGCGWRCDKIKAHYAICNMHKKRGFHLSYIYAVRSLPTAACASSIKKKKRQLQCQCASHLLFCKNFFGPPPPCVSSPRTRTYDMLHSTTPPPPHGPWHVGWKRTVQQCTESIQLTSSRTAG
jgi:hypothetical protein